MLGKAPNDVAPSAFRLARRKNLTVKEALVDGRWMKGLQRIASTEEIDQFIHLWEMIQTVQLTTDRDCIKWNLTCDGSYSAKSAYHFQFLTRIPQPRLDQVWRVKAEPKIKFYVWLLLQNRNWTADRLSNRGWPHDDKCALCDQLLETAVHLTLLCPFAKEVWQYFAESQPHMVRIAHSATTINRWWNRLPSWCIWSRRQEENCYGNVYRLAHLEGKKRKNF